MSSDQSNHYIRARYSNYCHQGTKSAYSDHDFARQLDRQLRGSSLDAKAPFEWDEDLPDVQSKNPGATSPEDNAIVRVTDLSELNSIEEADDAIDQIDAIPASELAPEILMRIFAFLDPVSLSLSAATCRSWAKVARDDATWRAAFATYFSLEAAQNVESISASTKAVPSLRRLSNMSWRTEFQQRSDLLRRWRKSRAPTVLSIPKVDMIKQISISKQHNFMLSASEMYGVASRSNPFTGKVMKGYLDAEGTANGAGNGNPDVEFSPNVTALAMGADANNVVWGFRSGEVGLTTLSRQGTNPRGAIKSHKFSPRGTHAGPVTSIALPFPSDKDSVHGVGRSPERLRQRLSAMGDVATTFVSAGYDGTVRLWSSLRLLPLWVASTSFTPAANAGQITGPGNAGAPQIATPICALDYDARAGIIVAGNTAGKIFAWYNLDVAAMLTVPPEATDPEHLQTASVDEDLVQAQQTFASLVSSIMSETIESPAGSGVETAVSTIRIDARPSDNSTKLGLQQSFSILAHHSGARVFLRHAIDGSFAKDDAGHLSTIVYGAAVMDEITAICPDFEPRLAQTRSSAASPMVSVAASPVLSGTTSHTQVPHLVIGPSPLFTSGTGQYPERKFICIGTNTGSIHLFDWDSAGVSFDPTSRQGPTSKQVLPSLTLEAHHTSITALELTALNIIAGTSDGTIKIFCSLSGDLIQTINDRTAMRYPARMLAAGDLTQDEAARFRVQQIIADHDSLIAAIGHQVLAFKADLLQRGRKSAIKKTGKSTHRTVDSKFQMQVDLRRDLRDSQAELAKERKEQQAEYRRIRNKVNDHELGDLSEQEAFEYALMLSKEEDQDLADALEQIALAEEGSMRRDVPELSSPQDWPAIPFPRSYGSTPSSSSRLGA